MPSLKRLDKHILEMHSAASSLIEYSWPNGTMDDEKCIICLKEREIFIDGYAICVVLSKNDHKKYLIHTLQIYSLYSSFLPFSLVCKLAKKFLADSGLYYVSVIQNEKKIYIWTVCYDSDGSMVTDDSYKFVKNDSYNGVNFSRVLQVDNSKFF